MREINFRSYCYFLMFFLGCLCQISLEAMTFGGFGHCIYPPYCREGNGGYCNGGCSERDCYDCGDGGNGYDFSKSQAVFMSFVPVVFLEGAFGETVGVDADYATIGTQIYTAFGDDPSIAFISTFKAHALNDHGCFAFASNIGFGFRQFDRKTWVTKGIHLFFDFREGRKHNYSDLGLSLEYLTGWYRIRINGYYPIGKNSKRIDHEVFEFPGGFVAECTSKQNILRGVDGDIEFPVLCTCSWEADIGAGAYYFSGRCSNTGLGGKAVARLSWNNFFALEARYTYDRLYGSRGQGVLIFNIPFCSSRARNDSCDGFMRQLVRRFDVIPLDECCCWVTNF